MRRLLSRKNISIGISNFLLIFLNHQDGNIVNKHNGLMLGKGIFL